MQLEMHRAGVGSGETLVLLHGIGSRWGVWEPVLAGLERSYDVIAVDLPGFGASPMPVAGTPAGPLSLARLMGESLDQLGVARCHIAGNSLGGLVALLLGAQGRALTVCGLSPAGFASPFDTFLTHRLLGVSVAAARRLAPHADALNARPRARVILNNAFFAHPSRVPARAAAADLRALADAPWFDATLAAMGPNAYATATAGAAGAIAVPVTIAWGEHDRVLPVRQMERARRALPTARFETLEDCGHLPTWDDPLAVESIIRSTIASAS